ncbi:hypothetical protein [Cognatishimia sp.]|uniref:hypothetical protein n=1 Tax=Cognatishimia sp. TaxID=2211648 RepID=UPI003518C50B|nr:hypothetical protein [Cognatishimia sp.]NQY58552.1 hypothetical protein [Cognatishimia sp.]
MSIVSEHEKLALLCMNFHILYGLLLIGLQAGIIYVLFCLIKRTPWVEVNARGCIFCSHTADKVFLIALFINFWIIANIHPYMYNWLTGVFGV